MPAALHKSAEPRQPIVRLRKGLYSKLFQQALQTLNAGVPLIVIVGNSNRDHSWKNMTQEARQVDILMPAVKLLIRVEQGLRIPELVRRAYAVATSGRP